MRSEPTTGQERRLQASLPWLWLFISAIWAAIIIATETAAWPLAAWIATTLGPLTLLRNRTKSTHEAKPGGTR